MTGNQGNVPMRPPVTRTSTRYTGAHWSYRGDNTKYKTKR